MEQKAQYIIFRPHAIQHYQQRRQKAVLPHYIRPKVFAFLWLIVCGLLVLALLFWLAWVPIYAPGMALVIDARHTLLSHEQDIALAVLLEPSWLEQVQVGETVLFPQQNSKERLSYQIVAVENRVISPEAVRRRFGLTSELAATITQPVVVAISTFESPGDNIENSVYLGSIYPVEVTVGSRRAISLVPVIGTLFAGENE